MDHETPARSTVDVSLTGQSGKRRLLAAIGIGAGAVAGMLPARWSKPLLESAIVPAHAQTSDVPATPAPPSVVTLPGGFALNQVTAVVYVDPVSGSASLSLTGPVEPGQLAALAVEDPGTGDFDAAVGIDFTLVNGIDRVQDAGDPEHYTVLATLRHDPSGGLFNVSMVVRVDATGTVYVLSAQVSGPQ